MFWKRDQQTSWGTDAVRDWAAPWLKASRPPTRGSSASFCLVVAWCRSQDGPQGPSDLRRRRQLTHFLQGRREGLLDRGHPGGLDRSFCLSGPGLVSEDVAVLEAVDPGTERPPALVLMEATGASSLEEVTQGRLGS